MSKLRILAALTLVLAACGGGSSGGGTTTVATPTFSPAAGTYATVQDVTVACTTAGAAIHYTLDGSTPTAASPTYSGPVSVTSSTTVKAMATAAGMTDSAVASATYTLRAGAPAFSLAPGTYATAQEVTLTSATPGATIHYTMDGTAASGSSPICAAAIPLPLEASATTTTIRAMARATGFEDSAESSATYVIDAAATAAEAPTFAPPAGTYATAQAVTLSTATAGASIYYTVDGSTPTAASTLYTAPVQVAASLTLKAIAVGGGHAASPVASADYVITLVKAATPTFSPGAGSYTTAQSVTIASTTAGAAIYYTVDGSTPTTGSTLYGGPVAVSTSLTLKAIAAAAGYATSDVGSAAYVIGAVGDFLPLCNGILDKNVALWESCLHANPDYVTATMSRLGVVCADIQREITAGLIHFDAAQGAGCSAAIAALGCADLFQDASIPAACSAALTGAVGTGGTCYSSLDCASGFCTWDLASGTCPGTCQPYAALGASCASALCADGQACDGGICKALSTAGGPCPCQSGFWCNGATCAADLAVGASCDVANDHCTFVSRCAGTTPTCQSYVGLGAACTVADDLCGFGYTCDPGTTKCVSWPTIGQACTFLCVDGYCDLLAVSPVCKAYLADGATCNPLLGGLDCASGNCNASSKCAPGPLSVCSMP